MDAKQVEFFAKRLARGDAHLIHAARELGTAASIAGELEISKEAFDIALKLVKEYYQDRQAALGR